MSNFKNRTPVQDRLGRVTRIEYVNRLGDPVDPKTGRPVKRTVGHTKNNFINNNRNRSRKPLIITASSKNVHSPKVTTQENGTSRRKSHFPVKTQGTMFGGLDPVPFDPTRDPPPRVCYNCWQPGHARRLCTRPVIVKVCNNCGRRGEDLSSCPRCSRAHKEYLFRLQAKERGEFLEPSEIDQLLSGNGEDGDEEELDDVLRQVMYRDDLVREQLTYQENPREPLYTRQAQEDLLLEAEERAREEEAALLLQRQREREQEALMLQREREREEEALLLQREREREEVLFLEKQREREAALFIEEEKQRKDRDRRERERDRLEREKERERREREKERRESLFAPREQNRENQERRIADLIHTKELEKNNDWSRDRSVKYDYYNRRPENSFNAARRSSITPASSADLEASEDPVKEILELTKSISHLSPETQEMIMRQVLAERKEKARFRSGTEMKERVVEREPQRKWDIDGVDDDPWA